MQKKIRVDIYQDIHYNINHKCCLCVIYFTKMKCQKKFNFIDQLIELWEIRSGLYIDRNKIPKIKLCQSCRDDILRNKISKEKIVTLDSHIGLKEHETSQTTSQKMIYDYGNNNSDRDGEGMVKIMKIHNNNNNTNNNNNNNNNNKINYNNNNNNNNNHNKMNKNSKIK